MYIIKGNNSKTVLMTNALKCVLSQKGFTYIVWIIHHMTNFPTKLLL